MAAYVYLYGVEVGLLNWKAQAKAKAQEPNK
jgi:hypothetical protein